MNILLRYLNMMIGKYHCLISSKMFEKVHVSITKLVQMQYFEPYNS